MASVNDFKQEQKYQTVVRPKSNLFDLNIRETFRYRDLIILFVKRDFISKYKQTILGPLWAIIQPLLTTVVFTIIFGNLANLTTLDINVSDTMKIPGFLFYMAGTICWSYFSSTVNATSNTFISNAAIMGKVYYPRLVTPISTALSNLISFSIQFAMFLVIWIIYMCMGTTDMHITKYLVFLPLDIVQMIILSIGFGIIISSLTTKYRDLAMLVGFGLQLWQYASPIAYGLALIPEKYLGIYMLNPLAPIVTNFRYAFFGTGYFNLKYYLISWILAGIVFFIGLILFNRIEKNFMDTI